MCLFEHAVVLWERSVMSNVNHNVSGEECGSMVILCDTGRCSMNTAEKEFLFVLSGKCTRLLRSTMTLGKKKKEKLFIYFLCCYGW